MPEDRKDAQTPARREPPRPAPWLRPALAAAENGFASRRVAPARASNDGNLAAHGGAEGAQGAAQPRQPQASNDGSLARSAPPVRERRVPADPGRIPAPLAAGRPGGMPRRQEGSETRGTERPETQSSGQGGQARAATPAPVHRMGLPRPPAAKAPEPAPRLAADGQPTAWGEGGSFLGLDREPEAAMPARQVTRPSDVPLADIDHGASVFEEEGGRDRLDATTGQTGEIGRAAPPRPAPPSFDDILDDDFPEPTRVARDPNGPAGPDYDRVRMLAEAMDRAVDRQRAKRRQKLGLDGEETDTDAEQTGQAPASGMSALLQDTNTHAKYLARGKQILKRYKRENNIQVGDEDIDPRELAVWLISMRPTLKPSSWRVYRLSVGAVIQSIPNARIDEALTILAETGRLEDEARSVYKPTLKKDGGNTSAQRAKRMDFIHFRKIRASLRKTSRSNAIDWLDDWLVAGINTGLRPGEWPLAHLEIRNLPAGRKIWLHVVNAKATKGRGNGPHRTLDISNYRIETLEAIERMIKRSEQWAVEGKTAKRQSDCAQLFYKMCNSLFPRMQMKYSLYSLRHQFIANMKAVYPDPAVVATLIGHISIETQVEHYGKRRSSWHRIDIKDVPVPMEEQVQQVQKYLTLLQEREHIRLLRKAFAAGRDLEGEDLAYDLPEDEIELAETGPDGDESGPEASG